MNSSAGYDSKRLRELASAVMDGTACEADQRALTEILRSSPAARDEYLALVDLHAILATELATSSHQVSQPITPISEDADAAEPSPSRSRWIPIAAVALAASLLIAITLLTRAGGVRPPGNVEPLAAENEQNFVTIAQVTGAVWASDPLQVGSEVGPATLHLTSGFVRLEYDSGVEVTLEGPAEYELINIASADLKSGLLTATVPPGAEGFTVNTPTAEVVDLGTSFGIDLRQDGFANVSVFDGEVEVAPRETAQKRLLSEGESVRIGENYQIEDVGFDPARFEKLWPIASGIAGSNNSVRFVPPWPRQIRFVQSDEDLFIAAEGHSVELSSPLDVNLSEPGKYTSVDDFSPATFQPGQRVRSYIVHYSPKTQLGPRRAKRVTGTITFARPILGVIVRHEELLASSRRFSYRGAGEGNARRELNFNGEPSDDRVTLSDDRTTLTLELIAPGRSSDLIRVIVDDPGRFRAKRRIRNRR